MGTHCFPEATILSLEAELRESRGIIDRNYSLDTTSRF
jgi:hypothetical protein